MKLKKRAPRLPGHLSRSEQNSFTSCQSSALTDTFTERPTSRCSNFDAADSIYSQSIDARDDVAAQKEMCRPSHDSLRPTLSPLLHSAIVHGFTPKARVKGAEKAPEAPTIKSVLGFHSGQPETTSTYWTGDVYNSPARCRNVASLPQHAAGARMSLHSRGDPRGAICQPVFTPGDLVWYQHPAGPWIAGRVLGLELHSNEPVYAVVTVDDGVRRRAQEPELQLRTSGQQLPSAGAQAEIIDMSASFEGLQVTHSCAQIRTVPQPVQNSPHRSLQSSSVLKEDDSGAKVVPKAPAAAGSTQGVPFQRQSCDLDASGLEKLRSFSVERGAPDLPAVVEHDTSASDQNTSHNPQEECLTTVPSQPSTTADPLSVPVWQNSYGETKQQLPDPLPSSYVLNSSKHHDNNSFLLPHSHPTSSSMQQSQFNACPHGHLESMFEPTGTPSTLRSPSDNGLMLQSSRAFSPTGAIINSALTTDNGSPANWMPHIDSEPSAAPRHMRKPSGFGLDPLQNNLHSVSAHFDPLSSNVFDSCVAQEPSIHGCGSLFKPDMSPPPSTKPLFTPNMVVQQKGTPVLTSHDNAADSAELFTSCMSTPATILSSQGDSDGIPTRIPSMPSTAGRTISGMLRACVADTLGFGSDNSESVLKSSPHLPAKGNAQEKLAASDELDLSLPQPPIIGS